MMDHLESQKLEGMERRCERADWNSVCCCWNWKREIGLEDEKREQEREEEKL